MLFGVYLLTHNGICERRASFDRREDAQFFYAAWKAQYPRHLVRLWDLDADELIDQRLPAAA